MGIVGKLVFCFLTLVPRCIIQLVILLDMLLWPVENLSFSKNSSKSLERTKTYSSNLKVWKKRKQKKSFKTLFQSEKRVNYYFASLKNSFFFSEAEATKNEIFFFSLSETCEILKSLIKISLWDLAPFTHAQVWPDLAKCRRFVKNQRLWTFLEGLFWFGAIF